MDTRESIEKSALEEAIGRELTAACLRRLTHDFVILNHAYARGRLRPPAFAVDDAARRLGQWDPTARTIRIASRLLLDHPWEVVVDTLKHEMAHQYVDEVLKIRDLPPHGAAFQQAARLFGTDPHASCELGPPLPGRDARVNELADPRLRRARRLLALASSPNIHEAEAALAKANELLLKYNLDAAKVRAGGGGGAHYVAKWLGHPTERRGRDVMILAGLIADHFFVEVVWVDGYDLRTGRSGRVLEVCGTPENIELAEHAYHELLRSADELWRAHCEASEVDSDRERRRFVEGVLTGYGEKLRSQRAELSASRDLVWLGDPGLKQFFKRRNPRLRMGYYTVSAGEAFDAGREAGKTLRLRRALRSGSPTEGSGGGRLLDHA
jgi:hypothetical protein